MTLDEIREEIASGRDPELVKDLLTAVLLEVGALWDMTSGVDPFKCRGDAPRLGTPNRRSMTYKLRKVAGFSYP